MRDVAIVSYLRTANSRSKPKDPTKDWFHLLRADELLARLIPECLRRGGVKAEEVEDFIVSSALGVNEQWTYGGRTPVFLANLPASIPAKFLDMQCGSSMAALHTGFLEVAAGFVDTVLVAGMEHMTRVPIGPKLYQSGWADMNERLWKEEAFSHWDMAMTMNMGLTAEKLAGLTGISRAEMDALGVRSHQLAAQALEEGFFLDEILPVEAPQADGSNLVVDRDQCIRPETNAEAMAGLKPAYSETGTITAGNASPLNARASAMVLMSLDKAKRLGLRPLGLVRSMGLAGVDPTLMGLGPVPAVRKALERGGWKPEDIDFWEINEAFAVVVLHAVHELGIDLERVNVKGGALALGHAMGATGIRLVGTLGRILKETGGRLGCAAACVGGGQGVATVIERLG